MKNIILLLFLFHLNLASSQTDSIPIGLVYYNHQVHLETDNDMNGRSVLFFNASRSAYVHLGVPEESYNKQTEEYYSVHVPGDPEGFPIFKLHRERMMWSKIPCFMSKSHCVIQDTLGAIDWTIYPSEKRRIAVYECVKATGSFGGRDYEAWFTYDIPIPSGPYKLGGLPGLILEAKTTDDKVQFLFVGIEISPNLSHPILPPSGKRINMSYGQYRKASNQHNRDIENEIKAKGFDATITQIKDTIEIVEDE